MTDDLTTWGFLRRLTWEHILLALGVLVASRILWFLVQAALRRAAEGARPRLRLSILRVMPIAHVGIGVAAVLIIVPILVEPTLNNVVALAASVALAVAFAIKDYGSSLAAGLAAVLENAYQPGDWIEVKGVYGEVKSIDLRAVRVVTADDTEHIIPHSVIWSAAIANATSGNRSLLCVAPFYLDPDHDAATARRKLAEIAETSAWRKPDTDVSVIVQERPWGTEYKLKAYVKESRDQFLFITDLTVRGKEVLRGLGIRFATAPYAELKRG